MGSDWGQQLTNINIDERVGGWEANASAMARSHPYIPKIVFLTRYMQAYSITLSLLKL